MTETSRPTVLVIDDEVSIADLYSDWLAERYDVRTAYGGDQAVDLLDGTVDVVLLDRRMPGQSGDRVLEEIRDRGLDVRVAMVTAVNPDFDIVEMGFDDYLVKPVRGEDLVETVERLLTLSDYDDELRTYYSLVTKRSLLEAERAPDYLEASEEYAALEREIEAARARLRELGTDLDTTDFDVLFRGLDGVDEGRSALT